MIPSGQKMSSEVARVNFIMEISDIKIAKKLEMSPNNIIYETCLPGG